VLGCGCVVVVALWLCCVVLCCGCLVLSCLVVRDRRYVLLCLVMACLLPCLALSCLVSFEWKMIVTLGC
jgi:hypothetical protein